MEAASGGTFRMRRNGAGCLRRHTFFWPVRKDNVQPPFTLMSKEKAAGGEKKTSQGGVASEQTPHPSSCPPQAADRRRPFRCSSFSHTNRFAGFVWEPCPFANPLKTTKKGAAAPFLGFSPEFGSYRGFLSLQNAKQMRICESGEVIEILCGCFGCILYGSPFMRDILRSPCKEEAYRIPYVKYSTGANKTTRTVYRAIGKPHQTAARRAFGLRTA